MATTSYFCMERTRGNVNKGMPNLGFQNCSVEICGNVQREILCVGEPRPVPYVMHGLLQW